MRSNLAIIFSFLFLFSTCTVAFASTIELVEISGIVQILRTGDTNWTKAASGIGLSYGDRIRSFANSAASLLYRDGTRIKMKDNTQLQLLASGYRLRYGSSWVRVVKQGNNFRTITPNAVVSVRGTIYSVATHRRSANLSSTLSKALSSQQFTSAIPRGAHLAASSLLLSLLSGHGMQSQVKVYRGTVAVSNSHHRSEGSETILDAGHSLTVASATLSLQSLLDVPDYKEWSIGYRRYFMQSEPASSIRLLGLDN